VTLGKHKAHVLKLRYRNTSNFEDSALPYRGGKRMDLAPALCGVAGRHTGPAVVAVRVAGISPPKDSCPRRILAAAAAGISPLPPPVSCR